MSRADRRTGSWPAVVGAVVAALLTLPVSGCGDSAPRGDREEVAQLIRDYYSALADGNAESVCSKLAGEQQRRVIRNVSALDPSAITCRTAVRVSNGVMGPDDVSRLRNVKISRVRIDGRTAAVEVKGGLRPVVLTKTQDNGWLISGGIQ